MEFRIKNRAIAEQTTGCVVVGVYETCRLSTSAESLDRLSDGFLSRLLKRGDLHGKIGQSLLLHSIPSVTAERVLLIGCGKQGEVNERQYQQIMQKVAQAVSETGATDVLCSLGEVQVAGRNLAWHLCTAVCTLSAQHYRYDAFKSIKAETRPLTEFSFHIEQESNFTLAQQAVENGIAIAKGVVAAKDVANCPPNVCNPAYLANLARQLAEQYRNVKTNVIDEAQMAELGMNAYLAVSRGSANRAFMSIIEYQNHPNPAAKPIVLIGKGLTFDTGGISIKPSAEMDEMKYDMGGAASVYGTMKAIAEMQLPLNVIGVLAGCENMPDGNAYRPGDIITTMSGLTVEVLNTDAEGRLVLCDTLTYVERFDPECVIDVATLTGACVVALGTHTSGLISPDDNLANALLTAAEQANDRAWRLPMGEEYQEQLQSNFADLANIGGRYGGAITAGIFLSNFTKNYRWAHLDIAGTAWKSGAAKGATGRPVPLLCQFLMNSAG